MNSRFNGLNAVIVVFVLTLAACSPSVAEENQTSTDFFFFIPIETNYDLTGLWKMVDYADNRFELSLNQTDDLIMGTMRRTNGQEPVDPISGSVSADGTVTFTRERPGEWTQVYKGRVYGSPGSYKMNGTFTQNHDGEYAWAAIDLFSGEEPEIEPESPDGNASIITSIFLPISVILHPDLEYANSESRFLNWNEEDLNSRFAWSSASSDAASGVWQVSIMPFPDDSKNWAYPPGLVASGRLDSAQGEFSIDFSQFAPKQKEVERYWLKTKPYLTFNKDLLFSIKDQIKSDLAVAGPSDPRDAELNSVLSKVDVAIGDVDSKIASINPVLAVQDSSTYTGPRMMAPRPLYDAVDLTGLWKMVDHANCQFDLELEQDGDRITGTMTRTNGQEPVDSISGSFSPDGSITFTRARTGSWTQVFTGSLSGTMGSYNLTGTFTHDGQGQYAWSASESVEKATKDIFVRMLPVDQRKYYVRVVALNETGEIAGLPSASKEVTIGESIYTQEYGKTRLYFDEGVCSDITTIEFAFSDWYKSGWGLQNGKDYDAAVPQAYLNRPSESCLDRWMFGWNCSTPQTSYAIWQVSTTDFTNDERWENPSGLIASGRLRADFGDPNLFNWPMQSYYQSRIGSDWIHLFPIDFTPIMPQIDPASQGVIYYVRVVAVGEGGQPGQLIGYPSPSVKIKFGTPDAPPMKLYMPTEIELPWLDMSVRKYEPSEITREGAMYQFVVVDNPSLDECAEYYETECRSCDINGCYECTPNNEGPSCTCTGGQCMRTYREDYSPGDTVDITPNKSGDFWDKLGGFLDDAFSFLAGAVNWVSEAWDKIQTEAVSIAAEGLCFGNSDCVSVAGPLLKAGMNYGLASIGIPPHLPNFSELCDKGMNYLTEELNAQLAAQAGVDPSLVDMVIKPDDVEVFVDACVDGAKSVASGGGGNAPMGLDFLKLNPEWQGHPANMEIYLKNNQNSQTLPGSLIVYDTSELFRRMVIPLPPIAPQKDLTIPVFFEENYYQQPCIVGNGCGMYDEWGVWYPSYCREDGRFCISDWNDLYEKASQEGDEFVIEVDFRYDDLVEQIKKEQLVNQVEIINTADDRNKMSLTLFPNDEWSGS